MNLTFQAVVNASGNYANTAQVMACDQYDPDSTPGNSVTTEDDWASATCTPQRADLSLTKVVSNPNPNVGNTVTFTLTLSNAGPDTATGVTVNDVIPNGYSYVAGSIGGGSSRSDAGAPTLTWTVNSLNTGSSVNLTFQAVVNASGNYANTAQVMACDQYDPDSTPGNSVTTEDDWASATCTPQRSDLSLTKVVSNPNPNVGNTVTFTLTLSNAGPDTATGVTVNDVIPNGYSYVAGSIGGGSSRSDAGAPTLTWTVNSLNTGSSVNLTFQAVVNASGNYLNTSQITGADQYDPDSSNNQASASSNPQRSDLSLSKTINDPSPNVGDTVTFTITLSNAGPDAATGVTVNDVIPNGYSYVAGSIGGGNARSDAGAPTLTWTVNSLNSASSVNLTFQAVVNASGNYANTAQVMACDQYDPDSTPGNSVTTEDDWASATCTPQRADLSLTKVVSNPNPNVGNTVTFTITLSNAGPDAATGVTVNDVLPNGYSYVAGSIGGGSSRSDAGAPTLTWTINSLNSASSVNLTFQAVVNASGNYINTSQITGADQYDPDSSNNQASASSNPQRSDLSLSKTINDPSPNVGDTVTFTITLSNAGPDAATGVTVNDVIPNGYSYVAGSIGGGNARSDAGAPTLTWTVNSLNTGSSVNLTFQAVVNASGNYANTAQVMACDQYDPDSTPGNSVTTEDDWASATCTPQRADLSLTKVVSNPNPNVGNTVTFTLTLSNAGPDTATGVTVNDVIPNGYSYVAGSIGGGSSRSDAGAPTLTWTVNSLNTGSSVNLTFQAVVNASGNYANTSQITGADQYDPDSSNNQASASSNPQRSDLSLSKTINDPSPNVGDTVTFTITLSNAGPDAATGVTVNDVLPNGYSYVAGSIGGGNARSDAGAPTLTWTVNSLNSASSVNLTFQAVVLASGNYANTAQVMACDQYDPDSTPGNDQPAEDDQASASILPQRSDLSLDKIVNNPNPDVGDTVTFTITLSNAGPDAATGVTVNDVLPNGYSYVAGSISGGDARNDSSNPAFVWSVSSLASSASVNLTLRAVVNASGNYANTAQVMACDQYDPDSTPGNDQPAEDDQASASILPQRSDLSLDKIVNNPNPDVGDTVTFTITLSNAGPDTATGVTVNDVIPNGYSYVAGSITGGNSRNDAGAPTLTWTVNSLNSGSSVTLTFQAVVNASGNYTNTSQITGADQYDPDPSNNQDTAIVTPRRADLSLTKTVNNPAPNVGETVTFTLGLSNAGPDSATNINMQDLLPNGYTYTSGSISGGNARSDASAPTLTWTVNSLASGTTIYLAFQAQVNASGNHTNTAQVMSARQYDVDSTPGNDDGDQSEDDEDAVGVVPRMANLGLQKTVSNTSPNVGDILDFRLTLSNAGPNAATNVNVRDILPNGYTYMSGSIAGGDARSEATAPTLNWTINTLASGASVDLTFRAVILPAGNHTNGAQVMSADQYDPDPSNNQASATATPQMADLSLTKIVDNPTSYVGDTVTFTVTVLNSGPDTATGVRVDDVLPAGLSYVPGSITGGNSRSDASAPTLSWTINSLASGASVNVTCRALVQSSGAHINTAQVMASNQYDPDSTPANDNGDQSEDDECSATVTTTQCADLSLDKTVDIATPNEGETVTFAITVSNAGPDTAHNVSVQDVLPDGYSYQLGSIAGGSARSDSSAPILTWTLNSIAPATSVSLTYQVLVLASGDHANVAQVMTSDLPDPDSTPGNGDPSEDDEDSATSQQIADLSLVKNVDDARPNVGDKVTFTITVSNSGPNAATNVGVEDILPDGLSYVTGSIAGGDVRQDAGVPILTWKINSIPSGSSVDLTLQAKVLPTGSYSNLAQVTASDQYDPDSSPINSSTPEDDQDIETIRPQKVDLNLTKAVDNESPVVGDTVTFKLTLSNAGPDPATQIKVNDLLPNGFSYVPGSMLGGNSRSESAAPTLSWTLDTLAAGSSIDLTFRAKVLATGNHVNTAQVMAADQYDVDSIPGNDNGDQSEDDEAKCSLAQVNLFDPPFGLKTVNDNGLPELQWGLVWINNENADSLRVMIVDEIPEGTTYVEGSLTCEARGRSETISCAYDGANNMVVWEGMIAADPGAVTEAGAENEVVITFRTTVKDGIDEVTNQAAAYWDRNADGGLGSDDDDVRNNSPALTDDISTSQKSDPTVWHRVLPSNQTLPQTGMSVTMTTLMISSAIAIILGLMLVMAGLIALFKRKRDLDQEPPWAKDVGASLVLEIRRIWAS